MKRLITLLSVMTIAAPVFAGGYSWTNSEEMIEGAIVDNKQAAYAIGLDMLEGYQAKSADELRDEFILDFTYVDNDSFAITEATVTVDEFLQENGKIVYQPVLNLEYEYRVRELGSDR
ncbi:DUF3316 domain-containing protein [Vibrio sp. WXL103]|uniref:DUF3316 domain-containing protein n=1 Tax=unclassified Vibrio TaxID=2614977 RepID=UPI0030DFAF2B